MEPSLLFSFVNRCWTSPRTRTLRCCPSGWSSSSRWAATARLYGTFGVILDHFSRISHAFWTISHAFLSSILPHTRHRICALLSAHAQWMLIGACNPMLGLRWYAARIVSSGGLHQNPRAVPKSEMTHLEPSASPDLVLVPTPCAGSPYAVVNYWALLSVLPRNSRPYMGLSSESLFPTNGLCSSPQ